MKLSGVTKLDRIRDEIIRGTARVGELSKKVQESRLKWFVHVLRRIYLFMQDMYMCARE